MASRAIYFDLIHDDLLRSIKDAIIRLKNKFNGVCPSEIKNILTLDRIPSKMDDKLLELIKLSGLTVPHDENGRLSVESVYGCIDFEYPTLQDLSEYFKQFSHDFRDDICTLTQDYIRELNDPNGVDYDFAHQIKSKIDRHTETVSDYFICINLINELPFIGRYFVDNCNLDFGSQSLSESITWAYIMVISRAIYTYFYTCGQYGFTSYHYREIMHYMNRQRKRIAKLVKFIRRFQTDKNMALDLDVFNYVLCEF